MKAIAVTAFGGPETLEYTDRPTPAAESGQALVRVEASGVGLADTLLRRGMMPHLEPGFTPGLEMAGTVESVGDGVPKAWVNSRAFGMVDEGIRSGCYAEFVAVDVDRLVPVPPPLLAEDAVALGVNALVAEFVARRARIESGEQVLVRGASGGIGVLSVQVAARWGATVTASTGKSGDAERLVALGATHVVDRTGQPLLGDPPAEFDVVLDPVAGPDMLMFTQRLRSNGRVVLSGIAGGLPPTELATAILDPRSITYSLLSLDAVAHSDRRAALREIFALAASGSLRPVIHKIVPLRDAAIAHEELESGGVFGKFVLRPDLSKTSSA